ASPPTKLARWWALATQRISSGFLKNTQVRRQMNTAANVVNCIRRMLGSIRVRLLLFVVVALAVSLMLAGLNIHVVAGGIMERMRENTIQAEISQICDNLVSQLDSVSIQMNTLQN